MNILPILFAVAMATVASSALVASAPAFAQKAAKDTVLVSNSLASVTREDYDVELLKIPADLRPGFGASPRRVNDLLQRMLVQKTLAAKARAAQIDRQPEASARIALETDKLLAQLMVESVEAAATAEFDAALPKYETRARELYLVDRGKFEVPEQVSATHILFDTKKRDPAEAKKLAQDARAKILAGTDMGALARRESDDTSAGTNDGKLGWFTKKDMDPAFADAAFALRSAGDVSEPVLSQFGWHVIRLDGRRPATIKPYEEARETVMAELRKRYVDGKRDEALAAIRRDPSTQVNREAIEALTPRVDKDTVQQAIGQSAPAAPPPAAPK